jgi:hypothetical protein
MPRRSVTYNPWHRTNLSGAGDECESDDRSGCYGSSEANAVVRRFNALSRSDKQAILDFLRSL